MRMWLKLADALEKKVLKVGTKFHLYAEDHPYITSVWTCRAEKELHKDYWKCTAIEYDIVMLNELPKECKRVLIKTIDPEPPPNLELMESWIKKKALTESKK